MKLTIKIILIFIFCTSLIKAQDTTKVLFIGNSFTYYNNMPQLFHDYAASAHKQILFEMHAPGGVSVGDLNQGTNAHAFNPIVYSLINSRKWDYVVIQDNQGRFILDSAIFPSASLVVQGHLMLRDSVKANNSCAKLIWFGGWGPKNGFPPYGNTGEESIRRILVNYRVFNDTAKEIIAPIGEAWIKGIYNLPATTLWDADDTHPSLAGSYLTASVIFHTIFKIHPSGINYTSGLSQDVADSLKSFAYSVVTDSSFYTKYNLGGIHSPSITLNGNKLATNKHYNYYQWYLNGVRIPLANDSVYTASQNGSYYLLIKDSTFCYQKSCAIYYVSTATNELELNKTKVNVYPNPVINNTLTFEFVLKQKNPIKIEVYDITGRIVFSKQNINQSSITINPDLKKGLYLYKVTSETGVYIKTGKFEVN